MVLGDGSDADGAGCDQDGVMKDMVVRGRGRAIWLYFVMMSLCKKDWLFGYIVLE